MSQNDWMDVCYAEAADELDTLDLVEMIEILMEANIDFDVEDEDDVYAKALEVTTDQKFTREW